MNLILNVYRHQKIIKSLQDKDKKRIIDFLERFSAEYYVRVVELTEVDCETMELQICETMELQIE